MKKIDGIQSPYVYFGSRFSSFGLHKEDGDLCSINYLHSGQPKLWYFVNAEDSAKLEALIKKFGPKSCTMFARHKTMLFPPSSLKANGIKFARIVQYPGDYIVTFYNGYHSGFNLGYNIAEAMNFSTPNWPAYFQSFKVCACK